MEVNYAQVVMAWLDDVLTVVGRQQRTIAEQRQQQQQMEAAHQQQQHALQLDVERLEGGRKLLLDTIKEQEQKLICKEHEVQALKDDLAEQEQKIISKEQEVQALKDELATVHRLLNEG